MSDPIFQTAVTNPYGLSDVGYHAKPRFADIDGDGDLDALVGNFDGNTLFYQNTGTAIAAVFAAAVTNPFGLSDVGSLAKPTFADIDGDGDLDALVGESDGNTLFYRNTGTATAPVFAAASTNPFGLSDVGYHASPTLVDIDGDGDLDAFVGEVYGDTLFYRNTGTATVPVFAAAVTNPYGLSDVGYFASPTFADIDGDGDPDAFVGEKYGNTLFYRNTGTATAPVFAAASTNPFGLSNVSRYAAPTLVNIDGDGDLDAFVGEVYGNTLMFINGNLAPILTAPTALSYTDTAFDDTFVTATDTLAASDANSGDTLVYGITDGTDNGDGTVSKTSSYGVLTVTTATGAYSFVANDVAIEPLKAAASANFTVTVSDGVLSDSKPLAVTIAQAGVTESIGNDTLIGTSGNDTFDALAGADKMIGSLGNDSYIVDTVGDKVIETSMLLTEIDSVISSIRYFLPANVENLTLTGTTALNGSGNTLANVLIGNEGQNTLIGYAGNDKLDSGAGNDTLNGGKGNDSLNGGTGLDVFSFNTVPRASNLDTITGFSVDDDSIQFDSAIFTQLTSGALAATHFIKAAAAADADDYVIYNAKTGYLLYDADGNGEGLAARVALLGKNLAVTAADFVVL